ncbi:MAG TPA: hypothetical protein VFK43_12885, partial [Acidimicrobiales bacterium]|nr:hypothetical protein [Acidimicrobiales bacterium]
MYDRDALLAATDLRALADDLLGHHHGPERSPTWTCPNPQHAQTGRTPPLGVFATRTGQQRWRCHGCGVGGTAIDLVMAATGTDVRGAMDDLARRAGHQPQADDWTPRPRPTHRPAPPPPPSPGWCRDPAGLRAYVDACAQMLWEPSGRGVLRWLTAERGLPETVLRRNRIGADLGRDRQPRPDGMPRVSGAVLPVFDGDRPIYAQIRPTRPWGGGTRYFDASARLAVNPRMSALHPARCTHAEVIVAEGVIDGLSATAAGY